MIAPLPLDNLHFVEFGITYLMLAPSRLQLDLLGSDLSTPERNIDRTAIVNALTSVGFHYPDQIYDQFQVYLTFLVADRNRDLLKSVAAFLQASGLYSGRPPHPPDTEGQTLTAALESLAGHAAVQMPRKPRNRRPKKET